MIRSKQWIRSRPKAFNCWFPEIRVHKFAHKCHGHWLLMQAQAKDAQSTQIIPNPILFASHMSPHVLNESKWTIKIIKTPASEQKKNIKTRPKTENMIYNLHITKIFINQVRSGKFQVLLVVLVAIQSLPRLQPMHPRIHRSTGRLRGASGWSRWPVGPQAFHQLGGHAGAWRDPGDPGDPPWPMATAFRRFFCMELTGKKRLYIDCSFLEKQVCSSPNILTYYRHYK